MAKAQDVQKLVTLVEALTAHKFLDPNFVYHSMMGACSKLPPYLTSFTSSIHRSISHLITFYLSSSSSSSFSTPPPPISLTNVLTT